MLVDCPQMSFYRKSCSLGPFIEAFRKINPQMSAVKIFSFYLNDTKTSDLKEKCLSLYHMKLGWHCLMGINL